MEKIDYSDLNYEKISKNIGLKEKHIPILLNSFVNENLEIMKFLLSAIVSLDFKKIKEFSHSVKGSSGNLQLTEIYELTKMMEQEALKENIDFPYTTYYDEVLSAIKTIKI